MGVKIVFDGLWGMCYCFMFVFAGYILHPSLCHSGARPRNPGSADIGGVLFYLFLITPGSWGLAPG